MSIRLRLTLLYSTILALTLIAFSVTLYLGQSSATLDYYERTLGIKAQRLVELPAFRLTALDEAMQRAASPDYVQLRDLDGEILAHSLSMDDFALPLSEEGLNQIQYGNDWVESAVFGGERFLIYNQPVFARGEVAGVLQLARSLALRDQALEALSRNLFIGVILVTLVAFGIGWWLSGVVIDPVQRITHTAQAIGAERDFARRLQHNGPDDEIGQLANTFNSMLSNLQDAYIQVGNTLQLQRTFVADVSHELRTPLTTIRGNIELLRRQPPITVEDREDVLVDMADESERLIRLVNDLLALARADARAALRMELIRIDPLVEEACRQAQALDPQRDIAYQCDLEATVRGDSDAIKQVLLILLDNALRHTHGPIRVTTSVTDANVAINVQDEGPGIPSEIIPKIFERFYRGQATRDKLGSGLGLPIAKALVEAQDGVLEVSSLPRKGSIFTVGFPLGGE